MRHLSRETLPEDTVEAANLVAFYVPMHTATRLAVAALPAVRGLNAKAHLCFYGLYAPVNESYLRGLGVGTSWRGIRGGVAFTCGEARGGEFGGGRKTDRVNPSARYPRLRASL